MKTRKKILVLLLIFIAAAVIYFIWPLDSDEEQGEKLQYTAMQAPALPVVYPQMNGREMAPLFGHMEEQAATANRGGLIVLPEDRQMEIRISEAEKVERVSYEIRSLDQAHLVERTQVAELQEENGEIRAVLPIQNLMRPETQYQLSVNTVLEDGRSLWYYTRILQTDPAHLEEMLSLAEGFSDKTIHYESSQELTMYMETSPEADNGTFGRVTLKNSFDQMTWGTLGVQKVGDTQMTLKELEGNLANIQLDYRMARTESGRTELFSITENFTLKWTNQRIYMMDYERTMDELFTGERELYSGKRILLGIQNGNETYGVSSPNLQHTAFVTNRELWAYDSSANENIRVFAFGGADVDDVRANHQDHGVEILEVSDQGDIDFLVYGYMNRGPHEGWTGISFQHYNREKNTLEEPFFIPACESADLLKADLKILSYKGANGNLYFLMDGTVYAVDVKSGEYVAVASGLSGDKFAVSQDGSRLAWQDNASVYDSELLNIMNLNTGERTQIGGKKDERYQILGFVGQDCVYGTGDAGDYIMSNGRRMGLYLKSLDILDENMQNAKHYEPSGGWIRETVVDESRVHIETVRNRETGFFGVSSQDTLVCNTDTLPEARDVIGWYASERKGRVYFVQLPKDIPAGKNIRNVTPKAVSADRNGVIALAPSADAEQSLSFCAYGRGRFLGKFVEFSDAVEAAYDSMGFVTEDSNTMIWVRGNKANSASIRDVAGASRILERYLPETPESQWVDENSLILHAAGCTLNQILYFVSEGIPVMVYTGEGSSRYIAAYDQTSVRLYDPSEASWETMELGEAASWLDSIGNDYVCCINAA